MTNQEVDAKEQQDNKTLDQSPGCLAFVIGGLS
ncbi:MAG: hypothetical protein ACI843_002995, partial [Psychrobacter glaciei]